ncbi:cupin domain-containing protein [Nocardioides luteus]|uniref:cupin domain-containing protein n=1 Tax=Nocardioides luteus TaxID=1844 RepID=UPI0018CBB107|nr:cupin domain-containing protein [Nocardioides luteus]MBG6095828.1 putative cupin superfamily protein [Nocardioides luteus]
MTTTPSIPTVVITDARDIELEDWGPLPEATGAPMRTAGKKLWEGDGVLEVGLWECEPGPSRWVFETNESITMLSGRMVVTEDGGELYEIKAGDSAVFPRGWTGLWDIKETVFKVYTAF